MVVETKLFKSNVINLPTLPLYIIFATLSETYSRITNYLPYSKGIGPILKLKLTEN